MEAAAADRRGFAVSWQPASQKIAATTGALVGLVLSELMTSEALDSYGWRIAFLIGAVTLPFGLWMRSGLPDSASSAQARVRTSSYCDPKEEAAVLYAAAAAEAFGEFSGTLAA